MTPVLSDLQARAVLGLSDMAGREEIARAWRASVKRLHPDRAGGDSGSFRRAVDAYRLLTRDAAESRTRRALRRFAAAWAV